MSISDDNPKNRYFLTQEVEVTREQYIQAERSCGFHPKSGNGIATSGFSGTVGRGFGGAEISGRVEYGD